ncbi:MAG: amidohydrolase family protein [Desulfohalobiaceae bacterium]|nr:amidohydrolase family protein [Desulfohalobiaceae bacterium]
MNSPDSEPHERGLRCGRILTMHKDRPLLEDGMLLIRGERIAHAGSYRELKKTCSGPIEDMGPGTLAPGLINAHTHLELSHLKGRTVQGQGFAPWVRSLVQLLPEEVNQASLVGAVDELKECGTACAVDITGHSPERVYPLLRESGVDYLLCKEVLGFSPVKSLREVWPRSLDPDRDSRISLSGHALYSTHPGNLQLGKTWANGKKRPFPLHLAESPEEVELLTTGRGGLADLLRAALLPEDYVAPGISPVQYADQLGLLDKGTLAVHCVQVGDRDIRILNERRTSVCLCPRSNAAIGVGSAPCRAMREAGIPLCLGTDSLASNSDLDLWRELVFLLETEPDPISLEEAVGMVTVNPARILGRYPELGTLQPGARARTSLVPPEVVQRLA